jgi:hypothetical protein
VDVDHEQSERATVASVALEMAFDLTQHVPGVIQGEKRFPTETYVRHVASPLATIDGSAICWKSHDSYRQAPDAP